MVGVGPKRLRDGTWVYPPIGAALATVVLDYIRVYITRNQNMVAKYIANRLITELCLAGEQNPGLQLSRQWWEHTTLDTLGIRVGHAEAEVRGETGTKESE